MMNAVVSADLSAILYLKVYRTNGIEADIPSILDTGFSEFLSLPSSWIQALNLPEAGFDTITLADGRTLLVTLYEADILWDGTRKTVYVHCLEGDALVGMSLMHNYLLNLPVRIHSHVMLSLLP